MLDTSALLTLRDDEAGAGRVEEALEQPGRCYACFLSRMEVLYRVWKDEGERSAHLADAQLQSLPLAWVSCSDQLLERAAALKACHPLSVADAWIAASAQLQGAVLVHKDPEFRSLAQISQEWLA